MNPQHTPTPWKLDVHGFISQANSFDGDHLSIQAASSMSQEAKANAAYIVLAVNCHEELLELAKWVADSLRHDERPANVNAIIAKAEDRS